MSFYEEKLKLIERLHTVYDAEYHHIQACVEILTEKLKSKAHFFEIEGMIYDWINDQVTLTNHEVGSKTRERLFFSSLQERVKKPSVSGLFLTERFLNQIGACEDGINFVKRNGFIGFPLDHLFEVKGSHSFLIWLKDVFEHEIVVDHNGNVTSFDYDGKVKNYYDLKGNISLRESFFKDGSLYRREYHFYDDQNRLILVQTKMPKEDTAQDSLRLEYNDQGLLAKRIWPYCPYSTDSFYYDKYGSLTERIEESDNTVFQRVNYERGKKIIEIYGSDPHTVYLDENGNELSTIHKGRLVNQYSTRIEHGRLVKICNSRCDVIFELPDHLREMNW